MEKIPTEQELIKQMINDPYTYTAIYARQSSAKQSESLETQVALGKNYAFEKNLLVYKVYEEAISATKNKINQREKLHNLLEDAKAGYFKYLIVYRRDRLARVFEDYLEIKNTLVKYGVTILFTNDVKTKVDNSPLSSFVDNILMAVAELEPTYIRDRVNNGKRMKKEAGEYGQKPPYGLMVSENVIIEGKRFVKGYKAVPREKNDIELIFETFLREDIQSFNDLHEALKDVKFNGIKNKSEIGRILKRPIYAKCAVFDTENYSYNGFNIVEKETGEELPVSLDYFYKCENVEGIIEEVTWLKAAEKMATIGEDKSIRVYNPFKRLLLEKVYCKKCNNRMELKGDYYKCSTCNNSINYKRVNAAAKENLLVIKLRNINNEIKKKAQEKVKDEIKENKTNLIKNINLQREKVEKFLEYPNDKDLRIEIESLSNEEVIISEKLRELEARYKSLMELRESKITNLIKYKLEVSESNYTTLKDVIDCFVEKVEVDKFYGKTCTVRLL